MSNKEKKEIIAEMAKVQDIFMVDDVLGINYKPHPYTIGPKHVSHAAKNHGGMLGSATLEAVQCAHPKCTASHDEHTHDTVAALKLLKNCTNEEAHDAFKAAFSDKEKLEPLVDGFIFVKNEFKIESDES